MKQNVIALMIVLLPLLSIGMHTNNVSKGDPAYSQTLLNEDPWQGNPAKKSKKKAAKQRKENTDRRDDAKKKDKAKKKKIGKSKQKDKDDEGIDNMIL
jgi:hypothetical protein